MASQCVTCADRPQRHPEKSYGDRCRDCQREWLLDSFGIDPADPTSADILRVVPGQLA